MVDCEAWLLFPDLSCQRARLSPLEAAEEVLLFCQRVEASLASSQTFNFEEVKSCAGVVLFKDFGVNEIVEVDQDCPFQLLATTRAKYWVGGVKPEVISVLMRPGLTFEMVTLLSQAEIDVLPSLSPQRKYNLVSAVPPVLLRDAFNLKEEAVISLALKTDPRMGAVAVLAV